MNSVLTLKCLLKSDRKRLKCHLYNGVTGCFSSWGGRNDALSLFPETQSHLSFGFKTILARKDFFVILTSLSILIIRESDLKSTSTFTFGTLPWLLFAFPSFFICTLSHCWDLKWKSRRSENVLAFEGAPWKDLWPKLRFLTPRTWKSQNKQKRFAFYGRFKHITIIFSTLFHFICR